MCGFARLQGRFQRAQALFDDAQALFGGVRAAPGLFLADKTFQKGMTIGEEGVKFRNLDIGAGAKLDDAEPGFALSEQGAARRQQAMNRLALFDVPAA
jgi:hypothetical protein